MTAFDSGIEERIAKELEGKLFTPSRAAYLYGDDASLLKAVVRRAMFLEWEKDVEGEVYMTYDTALNFASRAKDYFQGLRRDYLRKEGDDPDSAAPLSAWIEDLPFSMGWVALAISDVQELASAGVGLLDICSAVAELERHGGCVVMVADGPVDAVFGASPDALEIARSWKVVQIRADGRQGVWVRDGDGEAWSPSAPALSRPSSDDAEAEAREISYQWDELANARRSDASYDNDVFKWLFRRTWDYLLSRITDNHIIREDAEVLCLMHSFAKAGRVNCEREWEMAAADDFVESLLETVWNSRWIRDCDFPKGEINLSVYIPFPIKEFDWGEISGALEYDVKVCLCDFERRIDRLAEMLRLGSLGDKGAVLDMSNADFEETIRNHEGTESSEAGEEVLPDDGGRRQR